MKVAVRLLVAIAATGLCVAVNAAGRANGLAGGAWVAWQEALAQLFTPFEALRVAAVARGPGGRVRDVGGGTGRTTLHLRQRAGVRARQCRHAHVALRRHGLRRRSPGCAHLRRATTDTAALRCVAWRSAAAHPCMTTAERAAAPLRPQRCWQA